MKKLLTLALAVVALGSISWAATNLNSSRSNIYRLIYSADLMSQAQATKIVGQLDGKDNMKVKVNEVAVRQVLKENGVQADHVKKIIILPADKTHKHIRIILLTDPADEAQAIAVNHDGPDLPDKPKK